MRYKILMVSPQVFIHLCIDGVDKINIIANNLPEDSKYIRAFLKDESGWGNLGLVIESESFEDLKDGELIPILPYPTFEKFRYVNNKQ